MTDLLSHEPSVRAVRLLDADAEFARAVPVADRALADRALTLRRLTLHPGDPLTCDRPDAIALLLLDGAAWREVHVGEACAPQLLGAGSVLLPAPSPSELLPVTAAAVALLHSHAAVIDRRFVMAAARWPALMTILATRIAAQERDLGVLAAIGQVPRVDDRLHALLWHLAERWGTVGTDGVRVPLRLTHATLGRFVAARRPTVSLALTELRDAGLVDRDADGTWTLHGEPPDVVRRKHRDGPAGPPDLFAS